MSLNLHYSNLTAKSYNMLGLPQLMLYEEGSEYELELTFDRFNELVQDFLFVGGEVQIEDRVIKESDFVYLVKYVYTNSDLTQHDERTLFVNELIFTDLDKQLADNVYSQELFNWLIKLEVIQGWNGGRSRRLAPAL